MFHPEFALLMAPVVALWVVTVVISVQRDRAGLGAQWHFQRLVPRRWYAQVIVGALLFAPALGLLLFLNGAPTAAVYVVAGGLAAIVVAGLAGFVELVRQIRRVEDLATSRIRSAAQGYVEIEGRAAPLGATTRCPACGTECVWWSVVEKPHPKARSGTRRSSESPFLVEDGAEVCIVEPREAEWLVGTVKCHGSWARYLAGSRHIVPGDFLYVLGEFRTDRSGQGPDPPRARASVQASAAAAQRIQQGLSAAAGRAAADTDKDGVLSVAERQAFAAQVKAQVAVERGLTSWNSEVHRIGRPVDGRPFVVSTQPQSVAMRWQRWRLAIGGAGVVAAAAVLVALLLVPL
jgi:hypothetical protein